MPKKTPKTIPLKQVARGVGRLTRRRPRFIKRPPKKPGTAPGTLVPSLERPAEAPRIRWIGYDAEQLQEREIRHIEEILPLRESPAVSWINVDGLHDVALLETIGRHFHIHPLTLEDIANSGHRPKAEEFDAYLFLVIKMLYYDEDRHHIESEQVSLVLGPDFLVSLQERSGDVFDPVRERLQKSKGRIRRSGCDYLAYALVDAVVDHYFVILEILGDKIELLEDALLQGPQPEILQQIYQLKRELIFFRKQVWPIREMVNSLVKEDSAFIGDAVDIFFNDVYDHSIQIIDTIESYRDVLTGLLDVYLSTVSNRMNEVMKVLTIIATIFIPLSFIAGVYGMNFEYMPELQYRWAYPALWGVIVAVFVGMIAWFRHRGWL